MSPIELRARHAMAALTSKIETGLMYEDEEEQITYARDMLTYILDGPPTTEPQCGDTVDLWVRGIVIAREGLYRDDLPIVRVLLAGGQTMEAPVHAKRPANEVCVISRPPADPT